MIITYTIISLLIGAISGLIWSIRTFPKREVNRLYKEFKQIEKRIDGDWKHYRNKVDHHENIIVKPNCETLYSTTFMDLKLEGFILTLPSSKYYFGISFLNEATDVITTITNEQISQNSNTDLIFTTNKNQEGIYIPPGLTWLIVRFGIPATGDIKNVHEQQNQLHIEKFNSI